MSRRAVTDALSRLAFAAELLDDPRASAWSGAAWAVRSLEADVAELLASGELEEVRGIGPAAVEVVAAVLAQQEPEVLTQLEARLPAGLFAIRKIRGLGPKKIKRLYEDLGVSTLGELEYACRENRLVGLPGFGEKTQAKVLAELDRLRADAGALRRDQARAILDPIVRALALVDGVEEVAVVGAFGRGEEVVRELEILVQADEPSAAREQLDRARPTGREIGLHVASAATFGARRVWLTSSDGHRAALASRAAERGLHLDEGGLRRAPGGEPVACGDEDALYRELGLVPTVAERRLDGVPLVGEGRAAPRLVRRQDLIGALHNHTVASDGSATL